MTKTRNTALLMAIALTIASKKLQRHTGIAAAAWRRSLMEQAVEKFHKLSANQVEQYIQRNFTLD